jgi:hypothetical protein
MLAEKHHHGGFRPNGRRRPPFTFQLFTVLSELAKQMHMWNASNLMRKPLMTRISNHLFLGFAAFILTSTLALAQDQPPVPPPTPQAPQTQPPANGGWRRVGDPPPAVPNTPPATDPSEPVDRSGAYGPPPQQQPAPGAPAPPQASARPPYGLPAQLTLKPGTFFTVRTNTMLASNKSKSGDLFTATLVQPLVVNGVVIAQRGQTAMGRVVEAGKGKDGVHRLKLELTGITLADGSQVQVQSQLATSQGPATPAGVQAGTVVGTTAVGAAVGGIAGGGMGAGIGAGAGALVGIAGVIATRNHPAVLYPETPLTFQVTTPLTVSTANAPQAFRYVGPEDYERQPAMTSRLTTRPPGAYPGAYPYGDYLYGPGYAYPGYYPGYGYPYYWGPGFGVGFGFGRGFYGGRRFR